MTAGPDTKGRRVGTIYTIIHILTHLYIYIYTHVI